MPRLASTALALALVAAGCVDATAPLPLEGVPDAFELRYGGYGFGSHDVALRGDTLLVVRVRDADRGPPRADTTRVVRDAPAWRAFWAAARTSGVASWPRRCEDPRIADGGGFSLRIVEGGRTWERAGVNAYPRANGRCTDSAERSPEYEAFMAAVSTLLGRPYPA